MLGLGLILGLGLFLWSRLRLGFRVNASSNDAGTFRSLSQKSVCVKVHIKDPLLIGKQSLGIGSRFPPSSSD